MKFDFIKNKKLILAFSILLVILLFVTVIVVTSKGSKAASANTALSLNTVSAETITISESAVSNNSLVNANELPQIGLVSEIIDESSEGEEDEEGDEYAKLAIANVTNYVNVRSEPNENAEIVGYIYNGAVANIEALAGDNNDWFKINSGNVTGYIKAEFFIAGYKAQEVAADYVTKYATVTCDRLNVRKEASADSSRIGYIENGEKVKITEDKGDWLIVEYTEGQTGYISAEFVDVTEEFIYARTVEEDKAIKEAEAALLARENEKNNSKKENLTKYVDTSITPADSFGSNAELRRAIVDYACQYVGLPYVWGGSSLATGTDCSGFTMLVYKHFGYNLSRIPQGQLDGRGRKISYSEIQPGDIVLYSSKGVKATHAALYIGNGKVVHETNHRYGVLITSIDWIGPVWAIKNVID